MKLNTAALSNVTLGTPVLAAGKYFARITKVEEKPTRDNSGTYINITCQLHGQELPLHSGGMVKNNNFNVFRGISTKVTENYDPNRMWKELAVAVGHEGDELEDSHLIGKDVAINLTYKAAEGSFKEGNEIARFLPIKPEDQFNPTIGA